MRISIIALSFLSPFFFPFVVTLMLSLVASFFIPLLSLVFGVLYDCLFYTSGTVPYGTLLGASGFVIMLFVRQFVEERIIGG